MIAPATLDLDALLTHRLAMLAPELEAHRIAVLRASDGAIPAVCGDAEQLGQAFMHLVRNAIEAMPNGGTLSVGTSRLAGRVSVEVVDSGPGVAAEDVERIFRPFHTTKPLGGGLGLAVAREIVQAHGGSLTRRSQAGGCFVVTLPT